MIEYIKGQIEEVTPTMAVIDCAGVGYGLQISLNTFNAIQTQQAAKLYVHEVIREDAHILFGFATKQERELFLLLTGVNGIGGNTARMILSAFNTAELCTVIANEDDKLLKTVKGIGGKTAQRVIIELKDKITLSFADAMSAGTNGMKSKRVELSEDAKLASEALVSLGYAPAQVQKVVVDILSAEPSLTVGEIVKRGLKAL